MRETPGCDAKIRPFSTPTDVLCEKPSEPHDEHQAVLRDYAYPGSETVLTWQESDRRTFRGLYIPCDDEGLCVLPRNHRGSCAP